VKGIGSNRFDVGSLTDKLGAQTTAELVQHQTGRDTRRFRPWRWIHFSNSLKLMDVFCRLDLSAGAFANTP
jgi:hypothetical protein